MTDKTPLGDRMKGYEKAEAGRRFMPLLPVCARIDGKGFSKWTRGLARPYDARLSDLMVATTIYLVEQTQAVIGYTQSDEISLVFHSDDPKRSIFFDGRIQKMTSVLAAMTTAAFNAEARARIPERADRPALFDCRCWAVPTREEAANTLLWRERDATKNSLSMAARAHYPHKAMMHKRGPELHEMLHAKGVNWNDFPPFFKRGVFVQRRMEQRRFTAAELDALPPRHAARDNPDLVFERSVVAPRDMPPFGKVTNRVAVIFDGAEATTG